jgi:hypothetical protein
MAAHISVISTDGIFTVISAPVQGLDMKWYKEFRVEERNSNGDFVGYRGFYTTMEKAIEHFESLSPAYTER